MQIHEGSLLSVSQQVHWKSVDGQAVVLHFTSGDYFALDGVGTFLWTQLAKKPMKFADLLECLILEYNCSSEQAEADIKEFCSQLVAEKLLEIKDF